MNKRAIALTLVLFLYGSYSFSEATYLDKAALSFVHTIDNFHFVASGIMRGSQPSEKAMVLLKEYGGVRTILSLRRHPEIIQSEKEAAEKLGMIFINIPMNSVQEQSIEIIEQCLKIISDKSNQPIYVHCQAGRDRTGLILAAYRIKYDRWSLDDALKEMFFYGYDPACCSNLERSLVKWNAWNTKQA